MMVGSMGVGWGSGGRRAGVLAGRPESGHDNACVFGKMVTPLAGTKTHLLLEPSIEREDQIHQIIGHLDVEALRKEGGGLLLLAPPTSSQQPLRIEELEVAERERIPHRAPEPCDHMF